jgi:hypothetical protein
MTSRGLMKYIFLVSLLLSTALSANAEDWFEAEEASGIRCDYAGAASKRVASQPTVEEYLPSYSQAELAEVMVERENAIDSREEISVRAGGNIMEIGGIVGGVEGLGDGD